jgi:hypothetical protein
LPFYAPTAEVTERRGESTRAPMCESFGYKCAWFAVKGASAVAIADELLGADAKRATSRLVPADLESAMAQITSG